MKIIVAIDSLKGCLTSAEANAAAAEGIRRVCPNAEVTEVPVSDGGEGFLAACHAAMGGQLAELMTRDPLMRPVRARYLLKGTTAVLEAAQACGLMLLAEEERRPLVATSYGVGLMVADALRQGAKHIIVGLGGSGTSDAGHGMISGLDDAFGKEGAWKELIHMKAVRFTIATDVTNPLCGPNGAAHVFAPQKGATPDEVLELDQRAQAFAELSARRYGFDRSEEPGAGAAGGLGYAFLQYLDAECRPGFELLSELAGFADSVADADLIITGEGSADGQTLMGKLPVSILRQAGGVPVCLVAGRIADREQLLAAGFARVECINPDGLPLSEAMKKEVARLNLSRTAGRLVQDVAKSFDGRG